MGRGVRYGLNDDVSCHQMLSIPLTHTLTHTHIHVHMYIYVRILDVEFKFKGHC